MSMAQGTRFEALDGSIWIEQKKKKMEGKRLQDS